MITSIGQVTPQWLTETLRRGDFLPSGSVRSVEVDRIHNEQIGSIGYFLVVEYDLAGEETAPTRLFLKLARAGTDSGPALAEEVRIYKALAPYQHYLPLIPCYDAAYHPDGSEGYLLLADLSTTHDQPTWHLAIDERYITQTVDSLALLHAYWWEHPELRRFGGLPTADLLVAEADWLRLSFPQFTQTLGRSLDEQARAVYTKVLAALPALWASRTSERGRTLVHGDAHFWNFLYPLDPQLHQTYILDWQSAYVGHGLEDVAYTLMRYPQRTASNERALVSRYHGELCAHGVARYPWEACWADYRRVVATQILAPLRFCAHGLPTDFWSLFVERTLCAFADLNCDEIVAAALR